MAALRFGAGLAGGASGHIAGAPAQERLDYSAGEGRKTFFAFVFMLLLPFFVSLPFMLYQRLVNGLWFDIWQLALFAVAFAALMFLLFIELLYSVRARLSLGKTAVRFTLPVGLGPTPLLRYNTQDIPYHTIKSVELRREVFGAPLMPVLMRGAVIQTKDKGAVLLGYVSELDADPMFPFSDIAAKIAQRAAVPLVDQQTIWRRPRKDRALSFISEIDTQNYIVDPAGVDRLNVAHRRLVLSIISAVATLLLLGIGADLMAG